MKKIEKRHRESTAAELHGGEIAVSSKIDVRLPRVQWRPSSLHVEKHEVYHYCFSSRLNCNFAIWTFFWPNLYQWFNENQQVDKKKNVLKLKKTQLILQSNGLLSIEWLFYSSLRFIFCRRHSLFELFYVRTVYSSSRSLYRDAHAKSMVHRKYTKYNFVNVSIEVTKLLYVEQITQAIIIGVC